MSVEDERTRPWSIEEVRVLTAIYFNANFSIGDDARDECRTIADSFGRTPASIDRQWRNVDAVAQGKATQKIGALIRQNVADYLAHPSGSKALAIRICEQKGWLLESLISEGTQAPLSGAVPEALDRQMKEQFRSLLDELEYKLFRSGSQGFFRQRKVHLPDGSRYQAQVTAVLIGSKQNLSMQMVAHRTELAYAIAPLLSGLQPKTFSTGRVGFYANGKARVAEERFQVALQAVQIGES